MAQMLVWPVHDASFDPHRMDLRLPVIIVRRVAATVSRRARARGIGAGPSLAPDPEAPIVIMGLTTFGWIAAQNMSQSLGTLCGIAQPSLAHGSAVQPATGIDGRLSVRIDTSRRASAMRPSLR